MSETQINVFATLKDDIASIEAALAQNLKPHLELVSKIAGYILFNGGKRLRPLLVLLAARLCGYKEDYIKTFAIVVEYLHAATLLHDDLVDDAKLRRGKAVANSIWGNSTAVLVGDFLLARALAIASETNNPRIIKILAEVTENMSQGELQQLTRKGRIDITEDQYFEIIKRKTACLFRGACSMSAIIANANAKEVNALSKYGYNLGFAFQIADDLLDYLSATNILGKEVGADLREGKLTLPVIFSLKKAGLQDRALMEQIITNKNFPADDLEKLTKLIIKYKGISYAQNRAAEYVESAKNALSVFMPSQTKNILLNIADFVLSRKD